MNKTRVPFPRYLNAKRLFYKYEYDVVIASAGTWAIIMISFTWTGLNFLISMLIATVISYFVTKQFVKFFKEQRKGYITHLIYSKGYKMPFREKDIKYEFQRDLMPMGFEHEFID